MENICWNCNKLIDNGKYFCSKCNSVQQIKNCNYFGLFNLTKEFSIKFDVLDRRYFDLQQQFHPDRIFNATDKDKRVAIQNSMFINEAYQTLKSPAQRAAYLLLLEGIRIGDEQESVKPSVVLLEEVMEEREKLSDCNDKDTLLILEEINLNKFSQAAEQFAQQYQNNNFSNAAQFAIKMRYINKILLEIQSKKTVII